MYFIGIDIGGTFTDLVLLDEAGHLCTYKVESTPKELSQGVLDGIGLAEDDLGISAEDLLSKTAYFGHGTTAATNALIQHRGAMTGLITTKGFGDTIRIMRMMGMTVGLPHEQITHYSARFLPKPIVPHHLIKEVTERIDYKGAEIIPLDEEEARKAVRELIQQGVEAIAVCFLWSFRNPGHEQYLKQIIMEEAPNIFVTISSDLIPVIREYERTSTTIINAYLAPPISSYIKQLDSSLRKIGLRSPLLLLNSSGGMISAEEAPQKVVLLLLSGPTGGVMASKYLGEELGYKDIITTDMGGTSFDVSLVINGEPVIALTSVVERYPILTPMIDIKAIGAGGGSIASVENGYLQVGPQSAGALPGPVCYGRGGTEPTVTDADIVLGIIDPDYFLGGRMRLDLAKAEEAIAQEIAQPLGMSVVEAAAGIRQVVDNQMADMIRKVTIEKGHDPREFVLFAYGGAGPTHCGSYGAELGVKAIIIPAMATVHSAYGILASNIHYAFELSDLMRTPPFFDSAAKYLDYKKIEDKFTELEIRGKEFLGQNHIPEEKMLFRRKLDMRYRRQTHEVTIPIPGKIMGYEEVDDLVAAFEKRYEELYGKGSAYREAGIEITTFRVEAIGQLPKPKLKKFLREAPDPSSALKGKRPVYFSDLKGFHATNVYQGAKLKPGHLIEGPAIVEYSGTTVLIGLDQKTRVDEYLNLIIGID